MGRYPWLRSTIMFHAEALEIGTRAVGEWIASREYDEVLLPPWGWHKLATAGELTVWGHRLEDSIARYDYHCRNVVTFRHDSPDGNS
jgi:myo-inositol catabolism protein IolC